MEQNPFGRLSEEQLEHEYLKVNPNRLLMLNKYNDIMKRVIWDSTVANADQVNRLKSEITDYLDEMIAFQQGLGAALTAVNIQNQELGKVVKK